MFEKEDQTGSPDEDAGALAVWQSMQPPLRKELGGAVFDSWLAALHPVASGDERLVFRVPSSFIRDWVATHYSDCILRHWNKVVQEGHPEANGSLVLKQRLFLETYAGADAKPSAAASFANGSAEDEESLQQQTTSRLNERFTFENFVEGKSNVMAYTAAKRVAEEERTNGSFNPLFLYGGVGLGKTHLMHAIAWETQRRFPQRKCIYLSAEKFMYQFVKALRFRDTIAFKEQFRKVDILMVDDIQFIAGKESTQEEFFHTFNALIDQNHQVVISADRSPSDLTGIEERIRSRLGGGLVADIHPTDYELRLGILHMKMDEAVYQQNAQKIPAEVLEFLARNIVSNVREMEGALKRVLAHANFSGRPVEIDTVQDVLRDLLRANARKTTIDEIQRQVAEHYHIKISDMLSARRTRSVAVPRQVAMYLAKELTTRSLPEIGRKFGGRDHTTVLHATRKIAQQRDRDGDLAEDLELLRRKLND